MRKLLFAVSLSVVVLVTSLSSQAFEMKGFDKNINTNQLALNTVGTATFSFWLWDIYESRLMTNNGDFDQNLKQGATLYEIRYLRDIKSTDLIKHTIEQWQHLGYQKNSYQRFIPLLKQSWPDIYKGDRLTLLINGEQSAFYYNQTLTMVIQDKQFARMFLDIWLSERTSQPKLRAQLLGG